MKLVVSVAVLLLFLPTASGAQLRAQLVATGLSAPVALLRDPAAPDVLFIVEQGGLVKAFRNGAAIEPFLDLRGAISTGGERGLLGMAFDPNVASGRVYVNFTDPSGNTVIARFTRLPASPQRANPASRFDLRWPGGERFIRQPFANHNGGHLAFGPDGFLYLGLGDGGSGNDPDNHAQDPFSLLGKMLRIDTSVPDGDQAGYRVPPDNPFVDGQPIAALGEIWDVGLRNPWRYSFDDVGAGATGALIIGDVGQGAREEIDYEPFARGGRNYGWRAREGAIATPGVGATTPAFTPLINPIFDYPRSAGQAVTGGFVYRGAALGAAFHGRYFFADYVSSRVWSLGLALDPATGEAAATDIVEHTSELGAPLGGVASFGRDPDGELYLLTFSGRIYKLVAEAAGSPPVNVAASVAGADVTIAWNPPPGFSPSRYQLEAGTAAGATNVGVASVAAPATSIAFQNVPAGTYYVRVRSVAASGTSSPSSEITVTVGGGSCVPPVPPAQLTAQVSGRSVTLAWALGASVPAFQLEAGSAPAASNLAVLTIDGRQRGLAVQAPPGSYFVRIRSANSCGVSAASNEVLVTIP